MQTRNILLRSLLQHDYDLLQPHLKRVPLESGDEITNVGEPLEHACFPEGSVTSVAECLGDGSRVGIGIIGFEGMLGWPALLDTERAPHQATVQGLGSSALRIAVPELLELCRESATLQSQLLRFVQYFTIQLGRTIVSNLCDPVERRLARWLLMNHDRADGDELRITHDELGAMLGVRRATVTDTLHVLEGCGAIHGFRGRIIVRDRARLEGIAGETYGYAEAHYRRLIGPFGKSA